jgi:hypothetical protein
MGVELLTERYASQIAGVLGCHDRMLIFGTLPGICYAGGMTSLASFTGGEAEELRRAMGFKRSKERMKGIETRLRAGMTQNGIPAETQEKIVQAITAFALYGFSESHAASFARVSHAASEWYDGGKNNDRQDNLDSVPVNTRQERNARRNAEILEYRETRICQNRS